MAKCSRCGDTGYCKSCGGQKPCHCPLGRERLREKTAKLKRTQATNRQRMATPRKSAAKPKWASFSPPGVKKNR